MVGDQVSINHFEIGYYCCFFGRALSLGETVMTVSGVPELLHLGNMKDAA
jgi:hypothetical protein